MTEFEPHAPGRRVAFALRAVAATTKAILVAAAVAAAAPAGAQTLLPAPTRPDQAAVDFVLPSDLKWEGPAGQTRAKLYGDPEQPGPYAIIYKWEPGYNSLPHSHAVDRHAYVISGTWWMSTSRIEDKRTLYPVPQGSYVIHKANGVHWDGGVDSTALVLVTGIGPLNTTRLAR